jgi:hypothetical protein
MSESGSKMRSVQPPSSLRLTPDPPRPAYLIRLTLDGLDAWTSNPVRPGLGGSPDASLATKAAMTVTENSGATRTHQTPGQLVDGINAGGATP